MIRRRSLLIAAVVAATTLPLTLAAQPGGHHRRHDGPPGPPDAGWRIEHLDRLLDLSDAQEESIEAIFEANEEARNAAFTALGDAREALFDAARTSPIDEPTIRAKAAALGTAEGEAAILHARIHQQVVAVLTAEQAARLEELRAERDGAGYGMQRRMGRGFGPGR